MINVWLKVNKQSSERAQRKLREARKKFGDMRKPNRRIGVSLMRWINENFKKEGGNVGGWKPFKAGGRNGDTSAQLLQDTGRLKASFDYKVNRHNVTVGSNLKYSLYHEEGLPLRNLPARRMLPEHSDKEVSDAIIKIYDIYIKGFTR